MFATLSRSWEFAKISYGIIWDFKKLMIFPIVSFAASALVLASFLLPLWGSGYFGTLMQAADSDVGLTAAQKITGGALLFVYYFVSYTVIVFFNAALVACAFQVMNGEVPSVAHGITVASQRLPQIVGWALISAVIGTVLRIIEGANERAGAIVAALLGSAWTAMTFFVVPVLVIDGKGPIKSLTGSVRVLKETWGTALVGNFSLGVLAFLLSLPVILACVGLAIFAASNGSIAGAVAVVVVGILVLFGLAAFTSAADVVFKAVLYNYATGQSLPAGVNSAALASAFRPRKSK